MLYTKLYKIIRSVLVRRNFMDFYKTKTFFWGNSYLTGFLPRFYLSIFYLFLGFLILTFFTFDKHFVIVPKLLYFCNILTFVLITFVFSTLFKHFKNWYQHLDTPYFWFTTVPIVYYIGLFSMVFWAVVSSICYLPYYVSTHWEVDAPAISWEVTLCPWHCSLCAKQFEGAITDVEIQLDNAPLYKKLFFRHIKPLTIEAVPNHYHVWDLLKRPPEYFFGYGMKTPSLMVNPGGISIYDVWGDNPTSTPQNVTAVGVLSNPTSRNFIHTYPGMDLFPKHCSLCLNETHQIMHDSADFVKHKELFESTGSLEAVRAYIKERIKQSHAVHFHEWDLQKKAPPEFMGYGVFQPTGMEDPLGISTVGVWGSVDNKISPEEFFRDYTSSPKPFPMFLKGLEKFTGGLISFKTIFSLNTLSYLIAFRLVYEFWLLCYVMFKKLFKKII